MFTESDINHLRESVREALAEIKPGEFWSRRQLHERRCQIMGVDNSHGTAASFVMADWLCEQKGASARVTQRHRVVGYEGLKNEQQSLV